MYVDNTQRCFMDVQWAYAAATFAFALLFFKGFAAWLIRRTKKELIFSHARGKPLECSYPLRFVCLQKQYQYILVTLTANTLSVQPSKKSDICLKLLLAVEFRVCSTLMTGIKV